MKFTSILSLLPFALAATASTPPFFLIAVSDDTSINLKPVLSTTTSGSVLSLTTGTPTTFALNNAQGLTVGSGTDFAAVNFQPAAGGCSTTGQLIRLTGSSSNKCAASSGLFLESDDQNSQLGAQLTFNFTGGFFSCGGTITYAKSGTPSGCSAVGLWTVPTLN